MFRKKKSVMLFLIPGLTFLLLFYLIPFIGGFRYSFTNGAKESEFIGFANFLDVWNNKMFQIGFRNTLELSCLCAPLLWGLSYLLATALIAIAPRGGAIRSTVLLPYLIRRESFPIHLCLTQPVMPRQIHGPDDCPLFSLPLRLHSIIRYGPATQQEHSAEEIPVPRQVRVSAYNHVRLHHNH